MSINIYIKTKSYSILNIDEKSTRKLVKSIISKNGNFYSAKYKNIIFESCSKTYKFFYIFIFRQKLKHFFKFI